MLKARKLRRAAPPRKEPLAVAVDHRGGLPPSRVQDGRHRDASGDHVLRSPHPRAVPGDVRHHLARQPRASASLFAGSFNGSTCIKCSPGPWNGPPELTRDNSSYREPDAALRGAFMSMSVDGIGSAGRASEAAAGTGPGEQGRSGWVRRAAAHPVRTPGAHTLRSGADGVGRRPRCGRAVRGRRGACRAPGAARET